jgi:D-alanyl-lipoteichoic acid acyltransferase DltB (MBOAT superfamily)
VLFNSFAFLFLFLPLTLYGFFRLARRAPRAGTGWLSFASLLFYGYWNPAYVGLLLASMCANYALGIAIDRAQGWHRKSYLVVGVAGNLLVLGYFKYANFFMSNVAAATGADFGVEAVVLPLGISFFTFTQLAYIVDVSRGEPAERDLIFYSLFVTYFPHLIAGPILHHRDMIPQFRRLSTSTTEWSSVAAGVTLFAMGMAKKVAVADTIAPWSSDLFFAAEHGVPLAAQAAWFGALAYTMRLYFDFSGYSDMAIGLSLLFGVRLPMNFNSPYKASSIIEFWRRWHMTLSRFLRDYLYIPLGGSRHGPARRYLALGLTMLLGGLWHGAGWTFVVWGAIHGGLLVVNHAWRALLARASATQRFEASPAWRVVATGLTFGAVVVAWVFFRADTVAGAARILRAMAGQATHPAAVVGGDVGQWLVLAALTAVTLLAPNTLELTRHQRPVLDAKALASVRWMWRPTPSTLVATSLVLALCLRLLSNPTEFLYFNF